MWACRSRAGALIDSDLVEAEHRKLRRDLFFEDIARAFDSGLRIAHAHAEEGKDPIDVAREALFVCLHNVFVTFDHGTQLADHFKVLVVDEDGNQLTDGALHEEFAEHLDATGRYT
jgi:hypothetical protein